MRTKWPKVLEFFTTTDQLLPCYERGFLGDCLDTHSWKLAHLTGCHKRRALDVEINTFHCEQRKCTTGVIWLWLVARSVLIASFDELEEEREVLLRKLRWRWGEETPEEYPSYKIQPYLTSAPPIFLDAESIQVLRGESSEVIWPKEAQFGSSFLLSLVHVGSILNIQM